MLAALETDFIGPLARLHCCGFLVLFASANAAYLDWTIFAPIAIFGAFHNLGSRSRGTRSVSWALSLIVSNGGADERDYNQRNSCHLDHRQSLTEHNNAKDRRYHGVRIGKERRAHRSDHGYRNEEGDNCETVEHGSCGKTDPPGICLWECKVTAHRTK